MESQARLATESSDVLALVSRRCLTASQGQTYALLTEAAQLGRHRLKRLRVRGLEAARKPGWRWLASGTTGIGAGSRGVELGVRGGV